MAFRQNSRMRLRLMLFDAHTCIRQMLGLMLEEEGHWVVGQAESGIEACSLLDRHESDLVILDLLLVELNGLDVLLHLKTLANPPRVIVFTTTQHGSLLAEAHRARPDGFVHKADLLPGMREAFREVSRGNRYYSPFIANLLRHSPAGNLGAWRDLSRNERAVLQMTAEGRSSRDAAASLHVLPRTVDSYRRKMMRKLGLPDGPAVTRYAHELGLLPSEGFSPDVPPTPKKSRNTRA